MLFESKYKQSGQRSDYDIAPDGQRFLMIRESGEQEKAVTQINVVHNWFEELKRRVPTQ